MSSIDERVVAMRFQDSSFASGIKRTLDGLAALKAGLNLNGATKGISDLDAAGKKLDLSSIGASTDGISAKFVAMATIAITALAGIASKAMQVGGQMLKSLTVDPIRTGLEEYETNLNAIQTILANTQAKGTVLSDVNGALQELNEYSDKTIYNFGEMARNIGTFTAAGVKLDVATGAIKGIANLAALSGSNSQQASTAMYQLSQAMASGTVKLMDWNSVVNAGMGGEVFQTALKETARVSGVAIDDIIEKNGSFRESLQEGWLTSEILTDTLSKFTGDLSAAQLESMGYTQDQIQGILTMGITASDAATKVKTMTQLIGTLKESAQSGWSQTWQIVAGDFEEAKAMWTGVNDVLGGMIGASADARNNLLQGWKDLGGRDVLLAGIQDGFQALLRLIGPVKRAFEEIFPPQTAFQLYMLTQRFAEFMQSLKIGGETSAQLTRIFKGIFAAIDIVITIVKAAIGIFAELFKGAGEGAGNFLEFGAGIGDWIVKLRDAIKYGDGFKEFIGDVTRYVRDGVRFIKDFASAISNLFNAGAENSAEGMSGALERIQLRLEPLGALGDAIVAVWSRMGGVFREVWDFFTPLASAMSEFFGGIGEQISGATQDMDFSQILDTINTGLFAGLVLVMKKFLSNGLNLDIGGGFLDSAKSALDGVTGTLQAMQTNLKADTLMKIASALGILVLAVIGLTLIDSAKLTTALLALTVMFTQLGAAMAVFEKIGTVKSAAKMLILGAAMIVLSTAILILTASVKVLSTMEWEELAKGLAGVIALLGALAGTAKLMSTNSGGLISAGLGMIAVAIAIKILASAVEDFAAMSWEDMARGLAGVGATLLALGLFTKILEAGKIGVSSGVGLVLLAAALKILASAVGDFADMNYEELARGIGSVAVVLGVIAGTMKLMQGALPGAAALVIVSGALLVLAGIMKVMAGLTWEELAKGLAMIAGVLILIAFALGEISKTAFLGAAAVFIVAAALALLAPALIAFAGLSWEEIGKGLAMLAGVFVIFGLAGLALTPVIPTLLGLGIAIALVGAGVLMAGAGLLAFSIGLTALAAASAVGAAAIVALVSAVIGLIPMAMQALAVGIVAFVGIIALSGPQFVMAITTVLISLITAIATVAPLIINTLVNLVMKLIDVLARNVPVFVDKGLQMVTGILNGIGKNIAGIVEAALNIVTQFINGIAKGLPGLVQAGINLIITFVESLADGIRRNTDRMNAAGRDLASAIVEGMAKGISNGLSIVVDAAKKLAQSALNAAKKLLGINSPSKVFEEEVGENSGQGFANGLVNMIGAVQKSSRKVGNSALDALKKTMSSAGDVGIGIESDPVIRPVVDLSNVRKSVSEMDGMFHASNVVTPSLSYDKAAYIADNDRKSQQAMADNDRIDRTADARTAAQYTFIQNNNSPKALSTAEIYRQTKNQISVVKGALPK